MCLNPIKGYRSAFKNENGKYPFTLRRNSDLDKLSEVSCGRCWQCRLARSRDWALRCIHEASLYSDNCFITLTYNPENNPVTLKKRHFQLFMKRLRKKFPNTSIRYFQCGEYGSKLSRPHFHACLFNFDFPDKKLWQVRNGTKLYRSKILEQLWSDPKTKQSYGYSTVGSVTFESAAYVARYIMKKINVPSPDHPDYDKYKYHYVVPETGEILDPEYTTMSRRPGIGRGWYDKYKSDVYPHDFVETVKYGKLRPPKYYDRLFDLDNPDEFSYIRDERQKKAIEIKASTSEQQRLANAEIKQRKIKKLVRSLHE